MQSAPKVELPLEDNGMCYGCGRSNPIGLKMRFQWDAATKTATADWIPAETLQGWAGFVHGGIIACVLDEAMGWAAMYSGTHNVTAKMQVRFRQMLPIGATCRVSCRVTKKTSRLIETDAVISDSTGKVYAEGSSLQFVVNAQGGMPPER